MKKLLIMLAIFIIVFTSCLACFNHNYKSDICLATQEELVEMDDIGEVLAFRISLHLKHNKGCDIDDLMRVKGIGEQRLKEIKKHYY